MSFQKRADWWIPSLQSKNLQLLVPLNLSLTCSVAELTPCLHPLLLAKCEYVLPVWATVIAMMFWHSLLLEGRCYFLVVRVPIDDWQRRDWNELALSSGGPACCIRSLEARRKCLNTIGISRLGCQSVDGRPWLLGLWWRVKLIEFKKICF